MSYQYEFAVGDEVKVIKRGTHDFKVGEVVEEMNKGYQLADGSWSSEYKIGDKFVVISEKSFSKGSVVQFYRDDGSPQPCFKLIKGYTQYTCCEDELGAYTKWDRLTPYKEEKEDMSKFDIKEFKISDLKTGMIVKTAARGDYLVMLGTVFGDIILNIADFGFERLESYSENLRLKNTWHNGNYDVVKVFKPNNTNHNNFKKEAYNLLWEAPAKETPEQIRQRELREQYEATKKQLEELGKQIGVVE